MPPPPPPPGTEVEIVGVGIDRFTGNPRLFLADSRGHLYSASIDRRSIFGGGETPHAVLPEDQLLDPQALGAMNQSAAGPLPGASTAAQAASNPIWVRIPEGASGQALLQSIARALAPTSGLARDGLQALLNSPQFQALFQGGQVAQGATQMLSKQQLVGILIPPSLLATNPEMAKNLLIAQGLPAQLINSIPDRAIAGALQALLQTGHEAVNNPLHFLQAVSSALTLAGVPVQDVQNLLMNLLQAARGQGVAEHGLSADQMQVLTAKMIAASNPQLLGLNQLVQENFGQGLAQIFNAFIRVFMGGALMHGQQQWPQAVPNEKMLAELGGLFSAFSGKDVQKKPEERRSKKQGRKEIKIDDPAFQRVERKDDLGDEHREHEAGMGSIFIDMDEES